MPSSKKGPKPVELVAPPLPTPEQFRQKLQVEAAERSARCLEEVKAILVKHRCEIIARPKIDAGNIVAEWGIGARE